MRELSLFSGAGGGLLGTKLLGWMHCGYVEYNDYCQRIIAQRIEDGILDRAPIFGDIRAFVCEGYADAYQGMVDVVTAGFPCQPFSVAGNREGADDSRNMWPQTIDVIRRVRPRFALLENVPGLLAHEYGQQIFRDLAESGYSARWRILSAAECGAPHKRDRLWIVADDDSNDSNSSGKSQVQARATNKLTASNKQCDVPDTERNELRQQSGRQRGQNRARAAKSSKHGTEQYVADTKGNRCGQGRQRRSVSKYSSLQDTESVLADTDTARLQERDGCKTKRTQPAAIECGWWDTESDVGRLADGVPNRVDRLKALGNAQVPVVAATAWELLNRA